MPRPPLVYLDTNQWSYLADECHTHGLGLDPVAFQRASRAGLFQIVGSLDLIEELVDAIYDRPDLVGRAVPQLLGLGGRRVLQPLHVRLQLEAKQCGMLPERKRYLPAPERNRLHMIQANDTALRAVAEDSNRRKAKFKRSEEAVRAVVNTKLTDAGAPPKPRNMLDWYRSHDRDEWTRSIVASGRDRGLHGVPEEASWDYRHAPSVNTFVSYQQARIVQSIGEGRKIKPSDLADAHHAAAGPYYDILVTDDRAFRQALGLMTNVPFRCMTSVEFTDKHLRS